jgi:hypothetical protein
MQQHSIDHPNAKTCWETMALRDGNTKTALIVETDLVYDPDKDGYDASAFQSLKDAAQEYVALQTHIDAVVFYTIGDLHAQSR